MARAISFVFAHTDELGVDTSCYSLLGGSAGGRMAAWVSGYPVNSHDMRKGVGIVKIEKRKAKTIK